MTDAVPSNSFRLLASIVAAEPLRFTPAGLPVLSFQLEHDSMLDEAGVNRKVKLSIAAVTFGTLAERLAKQSIGSVWAFSGFLSNARQGKSVVFHIQDFLQN